MNILQRCRGLGVSIFYTHKKRNRTKQNIPFAQFPRRPGCPFHAIHPCCPDKLPAPWGYSFLTATSRGGYQNFTVTPRGGVCIFYWHFSWKGPPPPYEKFWTVPYASITLNAFVYPSIIIMIILLFIMTSTLTTFSWSSWSLQSSQEGKRKHCYTWYAHFHLTCKWYFGAVFFSDGTNALVTRYVT